MTAPPWDFHPKNMVTTIKTANQNCDVEFGGFQHADRPTNGCRDGNWVTLLAVVCRHTLPNASLSQGVRKLHHKLRHTRKQRTRRLQLTLLTLISKSGGRAANDAHQETVEEEDCAKVVGIYFWRTGVRTDFIGSAG